MDGSVLNGVMKRPKEKTPQKGVKKTRKKGLKRWFDEEWVNQRGEVGYKFKNDIYRPKHRITKDTPIIHDELTDKEINEYVESGAGVGKAGGYGIHGPAGMFISKIEGSYTNVVGLPVHETYEILKELKAL